MANEHLWSLPLMMILALLASLFEGVGLTLVIPLIQSIDGSAPPSRSPGYLGLLEQFIALIPSESRTGGLLALIFVAVFAKCLFSYVNMSLLGVIYGRISHRLRTAVFQRILARPLASLEREKSGKLLNTLTDETWQATDALNLIFTSISSLSTALVFMALLLLLEWKLALVAIGCLAAIAPLVNVITRRARKLSKQALEGNEDLSQQTWSTLNGLRTIHTFGREPYEEARFGKVSDRVRRLFLKLTLVSMTTGPLTEIMATGVIAVLVLLVSAKFGSVATLIAFIALLYRLQPRLMSLVSAQTQLANLHASIMAISEVLNTRPAVVTTHAAVCLFPKAPVSFLNVTFCYEGADVPAIKEFSFTFPSRGIVAIVGASGAGKSTLFDLLLGFQTPQAGEIRIGERALTAALAPVWRQRVGVVNQDAYIFDDTVRANILYGRLDASVDDVVGAARAVAAHEFIQALPRGYDSQVGERATQLSGGQKQRIALARALLREPDLLLLDEATNALDAVTEAAFQNTLKNFAQNGAVLVAAHKLKTVEIADYVIVLREGRVVQQGPPSALLQAEGPFCSLLGAAAPQQSVENLVGAARIMSA